MTVEIKLDIKRKNHWQKCLQIHGFAAYVDGRAYDFSYAAQLAALKQNLA